jgi:hypothetical protein
MVVVSKRKPVKQLSTLEMKKMLLSKMSDNELGSLVKNMELMVNLSGGNIYGDGVMMSCNECLKRTTTTDENVLRVQDLMINSFLRKNRFDESEINEIVNSRITN